MIYLTTVAVVANMWANTPQEAEERLRRVLVEEGFTVLTSRDLTEITLGAQESESTAADATRPDDLIIEEIPV